MIKLLVTVCLGGAIGSLLRYGVAVWFLRHIHYNFPFATLAVNITGCFLIGLFYALSERFNWFSLDWRLFFILRNAYHELQHAPAKNLIFLAISGITTSFSWIFYYRAMKEGQVSYVASIDKASIVVTLLLSFLILKEPITAKVLLGAGFIITGMLILIWK